MATVHEIKAKTKATAMLSRFGCLLLDPMVKLKCNTDELNEDGICKDEVVNATYVDESGPYPNTVHLKETGYWWDVTLFDIVD